MWRPENRSGVVRTDPGRSQGLFRWDGPPEAALAVVRDISRSLARYVDRLDHSYKECAQWT